MLFEVKGEVIKGRGLGRELGFPTVNIDYNGEFSGAFAGKVYFDNYFKFAAIHIGDKPTIGDADRTCESYLLDFNGDIKLGDKIRIEVDKKIRDTKKFENLELLKEQIAKDVDFVENWYNLKEE